MKKHQVVIVGIGLSALATAARLYELGERDIAIYTKAYGGTPFIAAINFVLPNNPYGDTIDQYYEDMINAGYKINNKKLAREMVDNTFNGYKLLKRWGVEFAKNEDGSIKLRHLSGHTYPRSLCCTTGLIGLEILNKLKEELKENGIKIYTNCKCVNILNDGGQVKGITIKHASGELENIYAPSVVAAWGGVGHLFGVSTYPKDIRGNTLAIANDVGADLVDIEFLEYEPMVVLSPKGAVGEPCPTAMLGEGGHLLNSKNERFMLKVRPQGESGAPKTLINKQIWKEVAAGRGSEHGGAWVDLRHIDRNVLKTYPWFFNRLMKNGVDPNKDLIEVGPMAHSFSGGILVNENYESTLKGLYAVGEACGGVHGACRCAGNAASQATLSGLLCAEAISKNNEIMDERELPINYLEDKNIYNKYVPKAEQLAVKSLGIYRDGKILEDSLNTLKTWLHSNDINNDTETKQIVESIKLMVEAALERKESRGTHMRLDYPETLKEYDEV